MTPKTWRWIDFGVFVLGMLTLDLGMFHRKSHTVGTKEALAWSGVWIGLSGITKLFQYLHHGLAAAMGLAAARRASPHASDWGAVAVTMNTRLTILRCTIPKL